jgi:regulatory protein
VKISKIKPQKRNKNRCSVYVDGQYRFGVTKDILLKHDLHEDDEITDDEIQNVLLHDEKEKIKSRAYRLLSFRERSEREMRERLLKAGYDSPLVEEVIHDLVATDSLNDERFASLFVKDYTNVKPKGNRFIVHELTRKGIDRETIDKVLKTRDERELMQQFIQQKLKNLNARDFRDRQRIARRLLQRGFTPHIVYDVLNQQ